MFHVFIERVGGRSKMKDELSQIKKSQAWQGVGYTKLSNCRKIYRFYFGWLPILKYFYLNVFVDVNNILVCLIHVIHYEM